MTTADNKTYLNSYINHIGRIKQLTNQPNNDVDIVYTNMDHLYSAKITEIHPGAIRVKAIADR